MSKSLKEILFVPHWIVETLRRNQMRMTDIFDYAKLSGVLPKNDLAALLNFDASVFPELGLQSTENHSRYFYNRTWETWWNLNQSISDPGLKAEFNKLSDRSYKDVFITDLRNRLFTPESKLDRYDKPFEIIDVNQQTGIVVIYPGYFTQHTDKQLTFTLVKEILKLLYVYNTISEVSRTSLFSRYLELLSGHRSYR